MLSRKMVKIISSIIAIVLVVIMVLSLMSSAFVYYAGAATSDELKTQLSDLEEQKAAVRKEISSLQVQLEDVEATRVALVKEMDITKEEIAVVETYISNLQDQIDIKTVELEVAEEQLAEKEERFANSIRDMYELGDTGYLQVFLNSSSLTMMLSRIEMVTQVSEYNKTVVEEYTAAKEDIVLKKQDLTVTQDEQKNYQTSLEYKAQELSQNEAEQAALQEDLEYYKQLKQEEDERLEADMAAISNEIAAMSAAAAAAAASGRADAGVVYYYSGDALVWPTPSCTSTSSAYGYRIHPIYGTTKFHAGEDIPASQGSQILAAAAGTVVTAGWVSGYGNYTVIDHGGGMMTAYGHQSSIAVSVGQTVTAGQTIGYVGSTGNSTGPHLHFEVYQNGATTDPKGYSYAYL